jgi:hypothetical protein
VALLAVGIAAAATAAPAQPSCSGPNEHLMSWPAVDPVWQFCWLRPNQSSGTNGSGIEIRNAYYKGHLALKRGNVPILNVKYETGNCGGANHCYRDWLDIEQAYLSDNVCPPPNAAGCGYAEPRCPPITVCEQRLGVDVCPATNPDDCPRVCFEGVSAEKLSDRLVLTAQSKAGWYRYEIKWAFFLDGRIQPTFGFSAVANGCVSNTHRHHAYWRFDFDIDGPDGDTITEGPKRISRGPLRTEALRLNNNPDRWWSIVDRTTKRGYRLVPGAETELAADTFAVGDLWVLKYKPQELDDAGQSGPACAIKINPYVNFEALNEDVVLWYRTGSLHLGGHLDDCHTVGPMFEPVGNWNP